MSDFNFVLLYVENPARSEAFYADALGRPAAESSPTFVIFAMESGVRLGLWGREGVKPAAGAPGGGELAFAVRGRAALDAVVTTQAQIIAYIDDYKLLMIATLAVMPLLIIFTKPPRAVAGDHMQAME